MAVRGVSVSMTAWPIWTQTKAGSGAEIPDPFRFLGCAIPVPIFNMQIKCIQSNPCGEQTRIDNPFNCRCYRGCQRNGEGSRGDRGSAPRSHSRARGGCSEYLTGWRRLAKHGC